MSFSLLRFSALLMFSSLAAAAMPAVPGKLPAKAPLAAVEQFAPQGELNSVRQVTARFSTDMIRLGDPRVYNPFTIKCGVPGQGRWVDTRNWVYDFQTDVPTGYSCEFTLVKGLRSVAGGAVSGTQVFRFNTSPVARVAPNPAAKAVLEFFVPQRETRIVRQVQTRFSEDMIRLGDPRVYNPFSISCPEKGKGRWVDTRNWVYDFERDLPAGLSCTFTLTKGLKTVAGKPVVSYPTYGFTTGAPSIVDSRPWIGHDRIEENQIFLVKLDGEADRTTLPQGVYCLTEGARERIPVRFLTIDETRSFVGQLPVDVQEWWGRNDSYSYQMSVRRSVPERRALQCARTLPAGAKMSLVWGREVASRYGVRSAQDHVLGFRVRPEFSASMHCARENARQACSPVGEVSLSFTDGVSADMLAGIRLGMKGKTFAPVSNGEGEEYEASNAVSFAGPFPDNATLTLSLPPGFQDESGRPLKNATSFPLVFKTGNYPPLAKFSADFGIVETAVGAIPLTLRNLEPGQGVQTEARLLSYRVPDTDEGLMQWLNRVNNHMNRCWQCVNRDASGKRLDVDPRNQSLLERVAGVSTQLVPKKLSAREFEVIGIPVSKPGVYVHEVESRYLGESLTESKAPMYVQSMNLVTNLGVHFRQGARNSLVWVTSLDKAQPVVGAEVNIWNCGNGQRVWSGTTDAQGIARINEALSFPGSNYCQGSSALVTARYKGDRGFVLSGWDEGIQRWRFNLPDGSYDGADIQAHTILDRSLLRAGETVHMRHLLREQKLTGLGAPLSLKANRLLVVHEGSDTRYELPLSLDAGGNGESIWKIPSGAKLGTYRIQLDTDRGEFDTGRFRVEEFRLPVLKARLQLPAEPVVQPSSVPVNMQLSYLNGGAYGGQPVTLRGRVSGRWLYFDAFEDFSFSSADDESGFQQDLEEQSLVLDAKGGLSANSSSLPAHSRPYDLVQEMEFRDPSGETQTVSSRATIWPAAVMPGIRISSWVGTDKPVPVDVVTVGVNGRPQANVKLSLTGELVSTQSHRKRTLGGFYAYEHTTKTQPVALNCPSRSDSQGRLHCEVPVSVSGELRLRVESEDSAGLKAQASASTWVSRGESWWFDAADNDRIDVLPEKKAYEPGDVMRFQVRMPFPEATALVSVERDGVIDTRVMPLSAKSPVIELPVKPEYAPNVYVSVFLVRGRSNDVQPTALVDLGKPAFKLGIAPVNVGWSGYRLGVKVTSDKSRYRPREKARVSVQVAPPAGQAIPAGTEVTLAAVDEALLELASNDSWDVLSTMMATRSYEMDTSTSQLQVVGKRHFGRKALPAGGGGGRGASTRELFDTLLFWQGRAAVDAQGHAEFSVPLNDSLTGFRLVAVATGTEHFGTGQASIQSSQDLQLISGLPLVVREGDRYGAEFTLRNASTQELSVDFRAESSVLKSPYNEQIRLLAGAAQTVRVPVAVPEGIQGISWHLTANAKGAEDSLRVSQRVLPAIPERVIQATLTQLDGAFSLPVQKPADALPGGAIGISVKAKLGDNLGTVKEWFRNYPYSCLEQKTSRSAGLQDEKLWADTMEALPSYLDDNNLAAFFPGGRGYPFLTAYVLRVGKAMGWEIPRESRERMLKGLQDYVDGRVAFDDWHYRPLDDTHRRLEVVSVLAQYGKFRPSQLQAIKLDPPRWSTTMLVDWLELLKATSGVPDRSFYLDDVQNQLRARLNLQGSALLLSGADYGYWWLYDGTDVATARLLAAIVDLPQWREDAPRLLRGLNMRMRQGYLSTTVANLWAGVAIRRFSAQFESVPVSGVTQAALSGGQRARLDWPEAESKPARLEWPAGAASLEVRHEGAGKPWLTVQSIARIPLKAPLSTGFKVSKVLLPVVQKVPGKWSAGDVVRVRLSLSSQSDIGWVVVDDPVPAGATLLGRALARDSSLLSSGENNDWVWPSYAEYAADAYRAYYERIYKGEWAVEYTMRLNQAGNFQLPPTRVEAMYAPEMFGMSPNPAWSVLP